LSFNLHSILIRDGGGGKRKREDVFRGRGKERKSSANTTNGDSSPLSIPFSLSNRREKKRKRDFPKGSNTIRSGSSLPFRFALQTLRRKRGKRASGGVKRKKKKETVCRAPPKNRANQKKREEF